MDQERGAPFHRRAGGRRGRPNPGRSHMRFPPRDGTIDPAIMEAVEASARLQLSPGRNTAPMTVQKARGSLPGNSPAQPLPLASLARPVASPLTPNTPGYHSNVKAPPSPVLPPSTADPQWTQQSPQNRTAAALRVGQLMSWFLAFPFNDPRCELCACGCGVHVAINTCIYDIVNAIMEQSPWDYSSYKSLVDECAAVLSPAVPQAAAWGFLTHARNFGVQRFGWAIVDVKAAAMVLSLCSARAQDSGLPPFHTIVSVGSGVAYVESVFAQALQQMRWPLNVVCLDIMPECYPQPFMPLQRGLPENLTSDFQTLEGVILMLCWPPLGHLQADGNPGPDPQQSPNPMASDALQRFMAGGGRFLIYIGERSQFGCTGDPEFHRILEEDGWVALNEDASGNSTTPIAKWCPGPSGTATGCSYISNISGNDSLWLFYYEEKRNGG